MTLKELKIGESAIIKEVSGDGVLRQHLLDMGMIPNAEVTLIKFAPMGDPMEVRIHGYELTLRLEDANKIEIDSSTVSIEKKHKEKLRTEKPHEDLHPGLGEGGKYHTRKNENPLPEGTILSFALMGNQNCGKTTLFNELTGSNQHVGNFPGVTVDRKDGIIKGNKDTSVVDLPGVYSLSPYSPEEIVSRNYILDEKPKGIINIVDATNIERNLYLTMQLMELDIPMVLALNMMDELKGNGGSILVNEMEKLLGIPVIPICASNGEGINELVSHAIHVTKYQEKPERTDFCLEDENGGSVHRAIHGIMELIKDHAKDSNIPIRFAVSKLIEGDKLIEEKLNLTINEKEMIEHIILQMESERGLDRNAAIADMRFEFIQKLAAETVVKPKKSKEQIRSSKLDKVLTGKWTAIPSFVVIMALIFYLTFDVIGKFLQELLGNGINSLVNIVDLLLTNGNVNKMIHSLVTDGILLGVGTVLSFLPIIVTLFFFLSILEDSGYMARIAFVMDKLLRHIGLSGRSIVPMLIGFGCTVPSVMATRTLPSERDRKMTILLTPFMSCTAKLPVYVFLIDAFFTKNKALILISLYFIGIIVGIIVALLFKSTIFKGQAVPFVMELPNYRMPKRKNVMHLLWDKTKDFIERAFTVIFIASIVIWILEHFDFLFNPVENSEYSMLSIIGSGISKIFIPMKLNDWRIATALLTGFIAKESVVSTLLILYGSGSALSMIFSIPSRVALLVFIVLYTPCVAAIGAIKSELGNRNAILIVLWQTLVAYVFSLIAYFLISVII